MSTLFPTAVFTDAHNPPLIPEQAMRSKPAGKAPLRSLLQFLPPFPFMMNWKLGAKINPVLPKLLWVIKFVTATEDKLRHMYYMLLADMVFFWFNVEYYFLNCNKNLIFFIPMCLLNANEAVN